MHQLDLIQHYNNVYYKIDGVLRNNFNWFGPNTNSIIRHIIINIKILIENQIMFNV